MPFSTKPSPTGSQKPVNVFFVWYSELCRRLNCTPAPVVKPAKTKCQTVLDFVADRLKAEEWNPVINALRHDTSLHVISIRSKVDKCQFLHEIDSEAKVRQMKRRCGLLWTAYILKSLLKSLTVTIRNSHVLTCLEFDGIPLFAQYLEPLLKALRTNNTVRVLSLTRCRISDTGCQLVCAYVRFTPNIEVLNLSWCGLTPDSGVHLAKLIKYQQINRYCESWHNSLRYADPAMHVMKGIKRITLNGNPIFSDAGLDAILNELDDDLWLKAIDLQKCGISEHMAMRILDVLEYNQTLEIVDLRLNDQLTINTLEKILSKLKERQSFDTEPEFQWCTTSFTLTCNSIMDSITNFSQVTATAPGINQSIQQSKSVPVHQIKSQIATPLRKAKTTDEFGKSKMLVKFQNAERKVKELNTQLQEEIAKRRETEKMNEELKRQLIEISGVSTSFRNGGDVNNLISAIGNLKQNGVKIRDDSNNVDAVNIFRKVCHTNGFNQMNGLKAEASNIFKNLIDQNCTDDENINSFRETNHKYNNTNEESESQISLLNYMEALKICPIRNGFCNGEIIHNK